MADTVKIIVHLQLSAPLAKLLGWYSANINYDATHHKRKNADLGHIIRGILINWLEFNAENIKERFMEVVADVTTSRIHRFYSPEIIEALRDGLGGEIPELLRLGSDSSRSEEIPPGRGVVRRSSKNARDFVLRVDRGPKALRGWDLGLTTKSSQRSKDLGELNSSREGNAESGNCGVGPTEAAIARITKIVYDDEDE